MAEEFGPLLRRTRRRSGLTQEDLAGASGLSVEGISLLERGVRRQPRRSTLQLLIQAMDLSEKDAAALRLAAEAEEEGEEQAPAQSPRARELPAAPSALFGRSADLAELRALVSQNPERPVALTGLGGVGKSALALELAHELADDYPDGLLYMDLRGTDLQERLGRLSALRALMVSLGEDPELLPRDVQRASALWRSATAERRILMLLDDVADLRQAEPLLPAHGSAVIMTSRKDLGAGSVEVAQHHLAPLKRRTARDMLRALATGRGPQEGEALDELADRCHGLPLAIRMVGARLTSRSRWPADYFISRIEASGGNLLDLEVGALSLRKTLVTSFEELWDSADPVDAQAAQLFLALGLIPGGPVSLTVAGCLVGVNDQEADHAVERLVEVSLLDAGPRPGTYVMHNLLREVARELAAQNLTAKSADEVRGRLIARFTALAWRTRNIARPTPRSIDLDRLTAACPPGWSEEQCLLEIAQHSKIWQALTKSAATAPEEMRVSVARLTLGLITYFVTQVDAAGWVDQLYGALQAIAEDGCTESPWLRQDLALALSGDGNHDLALEAASTARDEALELGDDQCLGWARMALSLTLSRSGRPGEARREAEAVHELAAAIDDPRLEAASWRDLTILHQDAGRTAEAIHAGKRALQLYEQVGAPRGVVMARINLGVVLRDSDAIDLAGPMLEAAVGGARAADDRSLTTEALDELGQWHALRDNTDIAVSMWRQALPLVDQRGSRQREARIRTRLAEALQRLGHQDEATEQLATAAQVHLSRGEWQEAAEAARQADRRHHRLRLVPDSPPARRTSG